jgi:hypothetical protein
MRGGMSTLGPLPPWAGYGQPAQLTLLYRCWVLVHCGRTVERDQQEAQVLHILSFMRWSMLKGSGTSKVPMQALQALPGLRICCDLSQAAAA